MTLTKIIKMCAFVTFPLLVAACASTEKSAKIDCGPWHFAIAKASSQSKQFSALDHVAESEKETCLKTVYAKGFDTFDPPPDKKFRYISRETSSSRRPIGDSTQSKNNVDKNIVSLSEENDDQNRKIKKVEFSNDNAVYQFDASSDWQLAKSPNALYQVFAKNHHTQAAMFISSYDANPFLIWSDARDAMYWRTRDELVYSDMSEVKELKINQVDAFQVEYRGRDKNGAPLHFLSTQLLIGKKVVYITTWCFEEDILKNQEEFYQIAQTLQYIPKT